MDSAMSAAGPVLFGKSWSRQSCSSAKCASNAWHWPEYPEMLTTSSQFAFGRAVANPLTLHRSGCGISALSCAPGPSRVRTLDFEHSETGGHRLFPIAQIGCAQNSLNSLNIFPLNQFLMYRYLGIAVISPTKAEHIEASCMQSG